MKPLGKNFDRLARPYRFLERIAFGTLLEQARFHYLNRLSNCRHILLLGEGDGRVLARVCAIAPHAQIDCLDASSAMLACAAARLLPTDRDRVRFRCEDVLEADFTGTIYDAVTTFFFLDCFTDTQAAALITRLSHVLGPDTLWLFTDFAEPAGGWRRAWARVWLGAMYAFFRWQTGLKAHELPAAEELLRQTGFHLITETARAGGFVRSSVFSKRAEGTKDLPKCRNQTRAAGDFLEPGGG